MKSAKLCEALSSVNDPKDLLPKLKELEFGITDITCDGDSILQLFTRSHLATRYQAKAYLQVLLDAGATISASNEQSNQETLFEAMIQNCKVYLKDLLIQLMEHPKFDPNQKTKKHSSIAHYILAENLAYSGEILDALVKHDDFCTNMRNEHGQTVLAFAIKKNQLNLKNLAEKLIALETFDINAVDQDGNNYLQLLAIEDPFNANEIAKQFIHKGINLSHKNHAKKSVLDIIAEGTSKKDLYSKSGICYNYELAVLISEKNPEFALTPLSDGKCILEHIAQSEHFSAGRAFNRLLELVKNIEGAQPICEKIYRHYCDRYRHEKISSLELKQKTLLLIESGIEVDIDYAAACAWLKKYKHMRTRETNELNQIRPINYDNISAHLKHMIRKDPSKLEKILKKLTANKLRVRLHLNNFDDEILELEEKHIRDKEYLPVEMDIEMFGHLFSLKGKIPHKSSTISLTGSGSQRTGPFIVHLMNAFVKHCEQTGQHSQHLAEIKQVRNMTVKAMRYSSMFRYDSPYSTLLSASKQDVAQHIANDIQTTGAEIFTGWSGHAIDLVIKGDLYNRCNGGGCSTDATIEQYRIGQPTHFSTDIILQLFNDKRSEKNKAFIQRELHQQLGLELQDKVSGKFQTVGNCSFESKRIAMQAKLRLFLPPKIADEIYQSAGEFFESFYLEEFCERHNDQAFFPHLLMRLIIQRLLPEKKLELIQSLLEKYMNNPQAREIVQAELLILKWKQQHHEKTIEDLEQSLEVIGITLQPEFNPRIAVLSRFLVDEVQPEEFADPSAWPVEQQAFQGYTLLHFAVMNNNVSLAAAILTAFPKAVNIESWHKKDPLCCAHSPEMVEMLVKAGANVNKTEYDNALDHAVKLQNVVVVRAIIDAGVKPSEYSLYYAASRDSDILTLLMQRFPDAVNRATHNHSTAIHAAARAGKTENVQTLIYYGGAAPDARDVNGRSPLQLALTNGHKATAKMLIASPCTLFKSAHRGDSVFAMTDDEEIQQALREKEAEKQADIAHFKQFISQKNLGVINEDADNLILAIRCGDIRTVRGCLLTYPNINVCKWVESYFTSPLHDAIQSIPLNNGLDYQTKLKIVELLLQTPAIDINAAMSTSEPLLFMATSIDDVNVLELFLRDPKLNVNAQDNLGYTALHDAAERGHVACVRRLLADEKIDCDLLNSDGKTAAEVGKTWMLECRECRELIKEHQAKTPPWSGNSSTLPPQAGAGF